MEAERSRIESETLRDGIQPGTYPIPTRTEKLVYLHNAAELGVEAADIGFPGSSETELNTVAWVAKEAQATGLNLELSCAARTLEEDIVAVIEASQRSGVALRVDAFIAGSEKRRKLYGWDLAGMRQRVIDSLSFAVKSGLSVMFVTEDTVRATDKTLELYKVAVEHGASRVCVCDTIGCAEPSEMSLLVKHINKDIIAGSVPIDVHCHDDFGLAVANSHAGILAGADRAHGTALGIGEGAGNADLIILALLFHMKGLAPAVDLRELRRYAQYASAILNVPIRADEPGIGLHIATVSSGVHVDVYQKRDEALRRGKITPEEAQHLYRAVEPEDLGEEGTLQVFVGPSGGKATFARLGIDDPTIQQILMEVCKEEQRALRVDELPILIEMATRWVEVNKGQAT